jgi:ADP-ribose pyrophosphatase YjhB (NUDIX family)
MDAKHSVNNTLCNLKEMRVVYKYEYERPALTVDCVIFGLDLDAESLKVMLIARDVEPFAGVWAIPGGFVRSHETLIAAATRELEEETGIKDVFLEQLYTFGNPGRDPRGWVISVAYYALVSPDKHHILATTDARDARWFSVDSLPPLAFDHAEILATALSRIRGKLTYAPIGFELLPQKFTVKQLQKLYEIVLGSSLDNRNFRKKIFAMDVLRELDEMQTGVAHRAARLYKFDERKYKQLVKRGLNFEL